LAAPWSGPRNRTGSGLRKKDAPRTSVPCGAGSSEASPSWDSGMFPLDSGEPRGDVRGDNDAARGVRSDVIPWDSDFRDGARGSGVPREAGDAPSSVF